MSFAGSNACTFGILALSGERVFQHQVLAQTKQLLIAYLKPYFPD